jgi:hypothetical protein
MKRKAYQHTPTGTWRLPLTKGYEALIDAQDVAFVEQWCWYAAESDGCVYAARTYHVDGKRVREYLHKAVTGSDTLLDHVDGNGLNNMRTNLRPVTSSQNAMNRKLFRTNTHGVKGVSWHAAKRRWTARITVDGKTKTIGYFRDILEAGEAYERAAEELHGQFRRMPRVGETIQTGAAEGES